MPFDPTLQPSPSPSLSPVPTFDNGAILHNSPLPQPTPSHTPIPSPAPGAETHISPQSTHELHIPIQIPLPPTPMPIPVVESFSIDAFTMSTPTMTLTPASSLTVISVTPNINPNPNLNEVRERVPTLIHGPQRSASVKPERLHTEDKDAVNSPEPEYDILDLTQEEREAYEKEKSLHLLRALNFPLNARRLRAMKSAGRIPSPLFSIRSRSRSKSKCRIATGNKENIADGESTFEKSPLGTFKLSKSCNDGYESDARTLTEMERLQSATSREGRDGESWYLRSTTSSLTDWERHELNAEAMGEPIVPGDDLCTPILPDDALLDEFPEPPHNNNMHVIQRSPDRESSILSRNGHSHTAIYPEDYPEDYPEERRSRPEQIPRAMSRAGRSAAKYPDEDILSQPMSRSAPSPSVQPRSPFYPYASPTEPLLGRKPSGRRNEAPSSIEQTLTLTHTPSQRIAQPIPYNAHQATPQASIHTLSPPQFAPPSISASPASSFRQPVLPVPPPSSPRQSAGSRTPGRPNDRPLDYMYTTISRPAPSCKSCGSSASSISGSEASSPAPSAFSRSRSLRQSPRPSPSLNFRSNPQPLMGANALGMSLGGQMTPRVDVHPGLAVEYMVNAVPPPSVPIPVAMPIEANRSPYSAAENIYGTPMHRSL